MSWLRFTTKFQNGKAEDKNSHRSYKYIAKFGFLTTFGVASHIKLSCGCLAISLEYLNKCKTINRNI